jgi:hypothetical protein
MLNNEPFALQAESDFFDEHCEDWLLSHEGEFALIKGNELFGFFPSFEVAFHAGLERLGVQDMLIEQIIRHPKNVGVPALTGLAEWQPTESASGTAGS